MSGRGAESGCIGGLYIEIFVMDTLKDILQAVSYTVSEAITIHSPSLSASVASCSHAPRPTNKYHTSLDNGSLDLVP